MPAAARVREPILAEELIEPASPDEPPEEPRARGNTRGAGLMKPLVILALPGMYLFYKYNQYRREQREQSRRRTTERELQYLNHKIVSLCFGLFFHRKNFTLFPTKNDSGQISHRLFAKYNIFYTMNRF